MTDAQQTNVQTTQVIEDTYVIITSVNHEGQQQSSYVSYGFVSNMLNPSPDTGIDSIFNLNTESTLLIDVLVTTIAELSLLSTTTLPLPPTPCITHLLKTLENDFSEFNQTNQFAAAVASIPDIVDTLKDEAQVKNEDFLNKLDDNIKKIIKDQVKEQVKAQVSKILPKIEKTINEQLKADVLTRSSNKSKTSYVVAANLSELELKKILIDKMESNKCRDDEDKDEEPSAGSNRGSKRRRAGKEPESTSAPKEKTSKTTGKSTEGSKSHHKSAGESAQAEDPRHTTKDLEEPAHLEFKTGVTEDQPDEETSQLPDWFQKPAKPPTPDRDWNKTLTNAHGPFKVDTLTPELLAGPTFKLMKRSCKSLVELEFFFEEVYKATTDQLDWNNPKGQQYHHDLSVVIQRRVEDLQLGVESYQKKLNLTKPDTYRSELKRKEAYPAYSNPRDFIYQNKDKKNKLMRIDELHKFSDNTLNDVRTALDDRLKGIRMKYLPQTIWRQSDRDKAGAMIQAIDEQLKTRRIM
ncbi:hypothetical protein Tco_0025354 [Tanacetum coccineum]